MRAVWSFVVAVLAVVLVAAPLVALADGRVALVVGNSTYAHIGRLPNPDNDARDMSAPLRDHWREAVAPGDTVVCAGDLGGRRNIFGRWKPPCDPCDNLPSGNVAVLGNHDFTRFRWRERPLGVDASLMTLLIHADPPLLVTHVPLVVVPDGCVNVHGHHHDFRPLENPPVDQRERRADRLLAPPCPHSGLAARQSARRRTPARGRDDDRPHPSSGLGELTGMRSLVGLGGAPPASSDVGRGVVVTPSGHRAR